MSATNQTAALGFDAVLFDLGGVVTRTARLHAAAWKVLFDEFLRRRAVAGGEPFQPFDPDGDYLTYLDGRPRHEGVRSFLAARGVTVPEGVLTDGPDAVTVHGLGERKNALFTDRLRRDGVEVFASAVALIRSLRAQGVKTAVVISSRNGREVLRAADLEDLFDARIDGLDAEVFDLQGKPHPDPFLKSAALLGVPGPGRDDRGRDLGCGGRSPRRLRPHRRCGSRRTVTRWSHMAPTSWWRTSASWAVADLDAQLRRKRELVVAWRIEQEGFDPAREHAMESLFTVGNGDLGVRGAFDQLPPGSQGDLFIAGIYDRKHPERPYSEVEFIGEGRENYPYS